MPIKRMPYFLKFSLALQNTDLEAVIVGVGDKDTAVWERSNCQGMLQACIRPHAILVSEPKEVIGKDRIAAHMPLQFVNFPIGFPSASHQ